MAVYRKKLVDKDGNTIIPAVGDIYGTVYTATLSNATAGGRADYEFTPDTPVENNKVYAVVFPEPTVNNATIILGDGVVSGSILVPPVAATDSPNYELLTTDMINNTEPLLLMYSGVQWVCLNQKKKVATADLENKTVKSAKIDWTTFPSASLVADGSNTTAGLGTVYYKRLLPNIYLLWGQITPTVAGGSVALPHPSFSETHSQVFTLYGAGMNSTKAFISNTDRSHIGFTQQNTGNTYALWAIAFLDESK